MKTALSWTNCIFWHASEELFLLQNCLYFLRAFAQNLIWCFPKIIWHKYFFFLICINVAEIFNLPWLFDNAEQCLFMWPSCVFFWVIVIVQPVHVGSQSVSTDLWRYFAWNLSSWTFFRQSCGETSLEKKGCADKQILICVALSGHYLTPDVLNLPRGMQANI